MDGVHDTADREEDTMDGVHDTADREEDTMDGVHDIADREEDTVWIREDTESHDTAMDQPTKATIDTRPTANVIEDGSRVPWTASPDSIAFAMSTLLFYDLLRTLYGNPVPTEPLQSQPLLSQPVLSQSSTVASEKAQLRSSVQSSADIIPKKLRSLGEEQIVRQEEEAEHAQAESNKLPSLMDFIQTLKEDSEHQEQQQTQQRQQQHQQHQHEQPGDALTAAADELKDLLGIDSIDAAREDRKRQVRGEEVSTVEGGESTNGMSLLKLLKKRESRGGGGGSVDERRGGGEAEVKECEFEGLGCPA
eukprot:GHVQ01002436.1.p1 GENE.GHVQ01002436.1~~GHVQ01002436.1.p1  ORF type:complete len:314 (-),score=113.45 GHVQ01002436.1:607-1524(-)